MKSCVILLCIIVACCYVAHVRVIVPIKITSLIGFSGSRVVKCGIVYIKLQDQYVFTDSCITPHLFFSRQSSMKPKDECCFLPNITLATHCYSSKIWLLSNIQQMLLLEWSPESTCKNKLMGKLLYAFLQQVVTMVEVKQHGNDFPKRGRCSLHYSRTEALLQQIHKKWGLWLLWSTHREENKCP